MKLFRMIGRSIRDSFKSVFRNFSLSLASITCITITLVVVAISIMASLNVQNFTKTIEKDVTMVVFLEEDIDEEGIKAVETQIKNIPNVDVDNLKFKSREAIKNEMANTSSTFKGVIDTWGEDDNPLQDTFLVKVKDIEKIKDVATSIEAIDKVDFAKYGEEMVEQLITAFKSIEKVAFSAVVALIVVTVFLIINTIKLTIFSRKREISIMRLVGASNFTIKTPFIIEGMVLGFIGSIIPIILTLYGYTLFFNHFEGHLFTPLIKLITPEPFIYIVSLIIVSIGIIVGMIGSASAVRKYLKV